MTAQEEAWAAIVERISDPRERLHVWSNTPVLEQVSEQEWEAGHAGTCSTCGARARFYPTGWHCAAHVPGTTS